MNNLRKYGKSPFDVVLLHGGPGAAGEMAPVAQELSESFGVLEPYQSKKSISGQIKELKSVIDKFNTKPVKLIGWSWGAWLAYLFSAEYPDYVSKLILISSGPFDRQYAGDIMNTRLSRLNKDDQVELISLFETFDKSDVNLRVILEHLEAADAFKQMPHDPIDIDFNYKIYKKIWREAEELRSSGKLCEFGKNILCPVTALHGDHDPHPYEGVILPLSKYIKNFKYNIIDQCGHHPWFEEYAKDTFYTLLNQELSEI